MKYLVLLLIPVMCSCSKKETALPTTIAPTTPVVTFEFVHGLEKNPPKYRASTSGSAVIEKARAELAKPLEQRALRINGKIEAGQESNPPWKWLFVQNQWTLSELNMELCDGHPSHIDEHLEEWLKTVGGYCPWASRVSAEL
jgi:hypothetical protein